MPLPRLFSFFFFFNDTATTEIYTLSLHDALPILGKLYLELALERETSVDLYGLSSLVLAGRSEEHTSELQSQSNLVCRLLLEKKKERLHRSRMTQSLCSNTPSLARSRVICHHSQP